MKLRIHLVSEACPKEKYEGSATHSYSNISLAFCMASSPEVSTCVYIQGNPLQYFFCIMILISFKTIHNYIDLPMQCPPYTPGFLTHAADTFWCNMYSLSIMKSS